MEFNKKWNEYVLYDLAIWKNGLAFKDINFSDKGKPIIKIAELKNGITEQTKYTNGDYGEDVYLRKHDLIFSWSGNPKTSIDAFIYDLPDGYLNQHSFKITEKKEIITKYFLYYILKYLNPMFQNIASNKQTTGLGHVTIADLKKIKVRIPSLELQCKILDIIKKIDNKICNNNQINDNLLDLIKTLYSEKIKNNYSDKFEEKTLDEFCNIFTGKKNANASEDNGKYKFFTCAPEPLYINSYIYDGPAIIVAGNGAYTGRTTFYNGKFDLYQRTYGITAFDNNDYIYLLYAIVYTDLQNEIMGGTHGSAIPYIVFNDIAKFKVRYNERIFNELSNKMKSLLIKIKNNEAENESLTQLRDTLLPKLMNGEIDLDKIEI